MSDTRRWVQPNWGPEHPKWLFGHMSPKFLHKDRKPFHMKSPGRFTNHCRNSRFNLLRKNEKLQEKEAKNSVS